MSKIFGRVAALGLVALLAAGCGGDEGSETSGPDLAVERRVGYAVVVDQDQVVRVIIRGEELQESVEVVPPVDVPLAGHHALLTEFLAWLDGGEPPVTQLSDNVNSTAMLYAALDIVANGGVKKASDYLP